MQKILIVEDEESISNLIKLNLTAEGYRCTCAFNGKAAADFIEKEDFDLILLDIILPEINGYELLEYIKPLEIHLSPKPPFLLFPSRRAFFLLLSITNEDSKKIVYRIFFWFKMISPGRQGAISDESRGQACCFFNSKPYAGGIKSILSQRRAA